MGAPSFEIKQLSASDLPSMRGLLSMFGAAFGEPDTYGGSAPGDAYLRRLLAKEHFIALAAVEAGAILGGLVAYVLEKFEQERSEIYIYDLAVAEIHRRRGIATALIEHLRQIALVRGVYVIFVQADHGDDPAIALYAKLGLREDVLHFDIRVTT